MAGRSDQGPRARFWIRWAGDPDQYSPSGTTPKTDEPGATSASLPTSAPGQSMLRAPTRARAPTRTGPRCTTSPSTQKPLRSTSGSIEQPAPSLSRPVTGGTECRSTSWPTSAPRSRANQVMYGAPARSVAPSSSTTRWASQSRRCTLPPRGWSPGSTLRSSRRAPPAASSIRPGGVTKTSHPMRSSHQSLVGRRVQPRPSASRRAPTPTQTSQRGPARARSASVATTCPAWVFSGVGRDRAVRARPGGRELVEVGAEGADGRVLVEVADDDLGEPLPEARHDLRRREAATAEVEEVVRGAPDVRAEDVEPELGDPGHRAAELVGRRRCALLRQRPGERVPVDLAGRPGRQDVDHREAGHERGRHPVPEDLHRLGLVEGRVDGDVADQQLVAGAGPAHRGRGTTTPGMPSSAESISPSSIRRPPSLTWSSARPPKSSPAGSFTTRSPLR